MTIYEKLLNGVTNSVAADSKHYPNGIWLADFFEEFSGLKQDQILELVAQLERMNVYRLKHTPTGARLMPIRLSAGTDCQPLHDTPHHSHAFVPRGHSLNIGRQAPSSGPATLARQ
jgi:hypothetical protein